MKQLLISRLANKFNVDPNNGVLLREVEWFMQQREIGIFLLIITSIDGCVVNSFKQLELDLQELLSAPKPSVKKQNKMMPSKSSSRISMTETIKRLPEIKKSNMSKRKFS